MNHQEFVEIIKNSKHNSYYSRKVIGGKGELVSQVIGDEHNSAAASTAVPDCKATLAGEPGDG